MNLTEMWSFLCSSTLKTVDFVVPGAWTTQLPAWTITTTRIDFKTLIDLCTKWPCFIRISRSFDWLSCCSCSTLSECTLQSVGCSIYRAISAMVLFPIVQHLVDHFVRFNWNKSVAIISMEACPPSSWLHTLVSYSLFYITCLSVPACLRSKKKKTRRSQSTPAFNKKPFYISCLSK